MKAFLHGLDDVSRGARALAKTPGAWPWMVAPVLLAAVILAAAIAGLEVGFVRLTDWALSYVPEWLAFLALPIKVSVAALLVIGAYFIFVGVVVVVSAPFIEQVSEVIETRQLGKAPQPFTVGRFLRDVVLGMLHAARRAIVYLLSVLGLFVLGLIIPVAGPLVTLILGVWLTARFTAYDAYDAVFARLGWTYRQKTAFLGAHPGRTVAVGAVASGLLMVPVVNLFAMSIAAAAATIGYHDITSPDRR